MKTGRFSKLEKKMNNELKDRVYTELGLSQFEKGDDLLAAIFKYTTKQSFDAAYENCMKEVDESKLTAYLDLASELRPMLEAMYIQFLEFAAEFADDGEVLQ